MNNRKLKMRERNNINSPWGHDEDEYQCSLSSCVEDKTREFQTFLHYSDPDARKERNVFGFAKKGLFYNYDDRLIGERWTEGWELAKKSGLKFKTAAFYEAVLKHFHDSDDLDLQHVILGCNMSNGYSYLVFGYTYTSKSGQ